MTKKFAERQKTKKTYNSLIFNELRKKSGIQLFSGMIFGMGISKTARKMEVAVFFIGLWVILAMAALLTTEGKSK